MASYNPFVSLYRLVTGRTVGGLELYPEENRMSRVEALRLYTQGSAWFSAEEGKKGGLGVGQLADLAVLSADYFEIPAEEIRALESVLTIVGGKPVHGAGDFRDEAPGAIPRLPEWSPVAKFDGSALHPGAMVHSHACCGGTHDHGQAHTHQSATHPRLRQLAAGAWQNMGLWGSG